MYKYFKGITVLSEERMPNVSEIAREYNLWMPLENSVIFTPNGVLIDFLIKYYIDKTNYKLSEYYYIDSKNVMHRVYPWKFVKIVMDDFFKYAEQNNIIENKDTIYSINNINFIYYKIPNQNPNIIDITEFKKTKGRKNND